MSALEPACKSLQCKPSWLLKPVSLGKLPNRPIRHAELAVSISSLQHSHKCTDGYRRIAFLLWGNVVRKTFFCVWFLSGEVTCAPLHPREARSGHLKSEDVPPNSSAIIYYSSWLLEANPQSLIGGFHWCEELSVPSLWDLQQCFLIETRFVWFISCFEADHREICQTCNTHSSSYCTRCDLVWSLSSGLRSTRKNYENSPEPEISSSSWEPDVCFPQSCGLVFGVLCSSWIIACSADEQQQGG